MVRWCHLYGKTFGRRKFISCWQINDRKLFRPSSVHKSTKRRESFSLCKSHFHYKRLADGFFNNVIASQTVSEPKRWNDSGKNMRFQLGDVGTDVDWTRTHKKVSKRFCKVCPAKYRNQRDFGGSTEKLFCEWKYFDLFSQNLCRCNPKFCFIDFNSSEFMVM